MAKSGKTDPELWNALQGLDDDLLDFSLPEALVDEELKKIGIDPDDLAKRGGAFIVQVREEERLSWQKRAHERRSQLHSRASRVQTRVPAEMGRADLLTRLEELRATDPSIGSAIMMAARKRKPEESSDDELRGLVAEMEALRAIEGDEPE